MLGELSLLFFAGLAGGMLNAVAGGGTFITFPALLAVGIPPVSANATNTFAVYPGYVSGNFALRLELIRHKEKLPGYILLSFIGGLAGAWLLVQTSDQSFRLIIPWLLLLSSLLFIFSAQLNSWFRLIAGRYRRTTGLSRFLLPLGLFLVCLYGGFFNAALGVILLSYLALAGFSDLNAMNGLKLLISSLVSLFAVVLFIFSGLIAWQEGLVVVLGALIGGYIAAHYSRKIHQPTLKILISVISVMITVFFFYDIYFSA